MCVGSVGEREERGERWEEAGGGGGEWKGGGGRDRREGTNELPTMNADADTSERASERALAVCDYWDAQRLYGINFRLFDLS